MLEGREKIFCRGVMISRSRHFVQLKRTVDDDLLKRRQNSHAPGGSGNQLEFLSRVNSGGPLGQRNVERPQNGSRGAG